MPLTPAQAAAVVAARRRQAATETAVGLLGRAELLSIDLYALAVEGAPDVLFSARAAELGIWGVSKRTITIGPDAGNGRKVAIADSWLIQGLVLADALRALNAIHVPPSR